MNELSTDTEPAIDDGWTRRSFLTATGAAVGVAGMTGCLSSDPSIEHGWNKVDSPTQKALNDVVMTTDGPYTVGDAGRVAARRSTEWEEVVNDGPTGAENSLVAAAVTDDGRSIWFCGDSGVIGRYVVNERSLIDHSAPKEKTSSWTDVAVTGPTGREHVYLINSSGELLPATNNRGTISWGTVSKPGGGLSVGALAYTLNAGYIGNDNGDVYRTTDAEAWSPIGIDDESTSLNDLAALGGNTVVAISDTGSIFHYDGYSWLGMNASEDALHAVDRDRDRGLATGVNGAIYELTGTKWMSQETSTSKTLHGATLGSSDFSDIVVGEDGIILERFG